MKKAVFLSMACIIAAASLSAQSTQVKPPPPPKPAVAPPPGPAKKHVKPLPPPVVTMEKFTAPVAKRGVKAPKKKMISQKVKFTPPVIVKDGN